MSKAFKSTRSTDPQIILNVARGLDPTLPPAAVSLRADPPAPVPAGGEELVQLNIRVGRHLADWLADKAAQEGISQKVWVCRALQASGAPVTPADLHDRVVRRRRGTIADSV